MMKLSSVVPVAAAVIDHSEMGKQVRYLRMMMRMLSSVVAVAVVAAADLKLRI